MNQHARRARRLGTFGSSLILFAACGFDVEQQAPYQPPAGVEEPPPSPEVARAPSSPICMGESCALVCPKGTGLCGSTCVDIYADPMHCGACKNRCDGDQGCRDGICNQYVWSETLAGVHSATVNDIAVGPKGSIVVAGAFEGIIELAGASYESAGRDAFVLHMDPGGAVTAFQVLGGDGSQEALAVALDASGRVAVAGRFDGAIRIGAIGLKAAGHEDAFVALLSPQGAPLWATRFGDVVAADGRVYAPELQEAVAVAFDSAGRVVVGGNFFGSIDLDGYQVAAAHELEAFVVKLGDKGAAMWSAVSTLPGDQSVTALVAAERDAIVVAGWHTAGLPFGPAGTPAAGGRDAFVARLAADGVPQWSHGYGGPGDDIATGVAVDPANDDILVAGGFEGAIDFGGEALQAGNGGHEIFVARLRPDAALRVSAAFVGEGAQLPSDVATTASGHVLLVGSYQGALDFGSGIMVASTHGDAFVARLDADLNGLWSYRYPGHGSVNAHAVAAHGDHAIVAGDYTFAVSFGGEALLTTGSRSIYVASFAP